MYEKEYNADFAKKMSAYKDKVACCDKHDNNNVKIAEEKFRKILECSNKMLEEAKLSNPEKMTDAGIKEIDKMIEENKKEIRNIGKDINKKCDCSLPKRVNEYVIDIDRKRYEPNRNNRFIINIQSKLYNPEDWFVRSFWQDNQYRLSINVMEVCGECVPYMLDKSIEDGVNYTIKKKILSPTGDVNYTVVYTGCKVLDYIESALDYDNDSVRTFTIIFDYQDYKYEF